MKNHSSGLIVFLLFMNFGLAQPPTSPSWGLYAAGVGQKLTPGMDPCWITYTVALTTNPKVQENLAVGTMGTIASGINWYEATALQRSFSRYFDDEPDGIYKLSPCEVPPLELRGTYRSTYGQMRFSQSGNTITGTYGTGSGTVEGTLNGNTLVGTWTEGTSRGQIEFTFNENGRTFAGQWKSDNSTAWQPWTEVREE